MGEVFGDDGDVVAFVCQVFGDGQDAAVVVPPSAESCGQHFRGDVVHFHPEEAAVFPDGDGVVQAAVFDPEVVQEP